MNKFPLTKRVQRPRVIEAIAEARAHGDLKENAEYHAARDQQSFIEGRVKEIEGKMPASDKVIFGATVKLMDLENDDEITYQIVGEDEADIKANRISVGSPVARGLIGKLEGDEVGVQTPSGVREYEILQVLYI